MTDESYREVIIFVAGRTPQIITETLYALNNKKPSIKPDEINIITTETGGQIIRKALIEQSRLKAFYDDVSLSYVEPVFHIIKNEDGTTLDDIKTHKHNEAVGDMIVELVRNRTKNPANRVHCSIAGGRKTMSYYLGSVLGLFGRPWDRLYHVLVTPEFESHPDFYWKPKKDIFIEIKDINGRVTKKINTKDAEITLAELPFIRVRNKISLNGKGFRELVSEGQRDIDTASVQLPISVNVADRTIAIGSHIIDTVPMQHAIYLALLRRKLNNCPYVKRNYCLDCTDCYPYLADLSNKRALDEMAEDYKKMWGKNISRVEEFKSQWPEGIEVPILRQNISKINKSIRETIDNDTLASYYIVSPVGKHGNKRHGIKVERGKIRIEG